MQVFLTLCLFFFALPTVAAEQAFIIDNIYTDKAADTPTNARTLAIDDAQRQGFELLLAKLTDANARRTLPRLNAEGIAALVQSFEITDEKIIGSRYRARVSVFYNEALVREFLAQNKVEVLALKSPPVLILPMLNDGAKELLWEPENPWREAWRQGIPQDAPITLVLPIGDVEDVQNVSAGDLKAQKWDSLLGMANRYGATEVMIADAFFVEEGKRLVVRLQPVGTSPTLANLKDYQQEFDATQEAFWMQAVASIQQKIAEQWPAKNQPLVETTGNKVRAVVALQEGREWLEIKNRLEGVAEISAMEVLELSLSKVVLSLEYNASLARLKEGVAARNLELIQEGDVWVLRNMLEPKP